MTVERGVNLEQDLVRIQVEGHRKTGKSDFILSIIEHLAERGYSPQSLMVVIFDWDLGGILPLLKRGRIPLEYKESIIYCPLDDIMEAHNIWAEVKPKLEEHARKYGPETAWVCIENMGQMWESTRDSFSRIVYDEPLYKRLLNAKKAAKMSGKKKLPEFDQMQDYGVINPMHNDLRNSILSGKFNVVVTTHLKDVYENREIVGYVGDGQKNNEAFVDFILRKKVVAGKFFADLMGSRFTKILFRDLENPTFTSFWEMIYKIMDKESKAVNLTISHYWMDISPKTPKTPSTPPADAIKEPEPDNHKTGKSTPVKAKKPKEGKPKTGPGSEVEW